MSKKIIAFLTGTLLATGMLVAQTGASTVATVPDGMMSFVITQGKTTYLSLPLTNTETYTGVVASVTTNAVAVDDSPAPFTSNLASAGAPYFVKFLSGNEAGRVMLITSNTPSVLTLDTTDHISGEAVALTTTGFNVQEGDTFEVFPGDTLASIFGDNTSGNSLVLTGGAAPARSDEVTLYTASNVAAATYYFNANRNCWEQVGTSVNANNTIIYPYSAMAVTRRAGNPTTSLTVAGRVTQVSAETKVVSKGSVYTSSHYAADVTLSSLNFGANWVQSASMWSADTLSVWNAALNRFDIFYQKPDSTWRKYPDSTTDQSNFIIPAGTVTTIAKCKAVSGAASFVQSSLPYTLQ